MVDAHIVTHIRDGLVPGLNSGPAVSSAEFVHSAKLVEFRAEVSDRFSPAAGKAVRFRRVGDAAIGSGMGIWIEGWGHAQAGASIGAGGDQWDQWVGQCSN